MKSLKRPQPIDEHGPQSGMSLLETMVALGMLLIVSAGVMSVSILAISTTENQGHLEARATEYAQDKMEQLLALAYGDSTTDTTVFPAVSAGGQGLTPDTTSTLAAPTANYVDYLDMEGKPLGGGAAAPATWFYKRVWQISIPPGTTNVKQITVIATVRSDVGASGAVPQATVVCLKTSPF